LPVSVPRVVSYHRCTVLEDALFSVSSLKDEKLTKKQTYTKTETCKLYSGLF